jgi:hypothetical protein
MSNESKEGRNGTKERRKERKEEATKERNEQRKKEAGKKERRKERKKERKNQSQPCQRRSIVTACPPYLDGTPSSLACLGKVSSFVQVKTVESFLHHSHRPARRWRSSLPSSALHHTNHVNHHHSISTPINVFSTHHDTTRHDTTRHDTTQHNTS